MPTVYKITYPNGKIYVGQDMTDTLTYFGSVNSALVSADFNEEARRSFSIIKETLWFDADADRATACRMEKQHILALKANDPLVGYNRTPKFRSNPDRHSSEGWGPGRCQPSLA